MAADNFVVIRRTISQTLVPYKEVQEKLLLKRSRERLSSSGRVRRPHFGSTTTVAQHDGAQQWKDSAGKRVTFDERPNCILERSLERSRSEVCLRRKSSYIRETSLDVYQERREHGPAGSVKPILRRREREVNSNSTARRANAAKLLTRPQSDFFPEFQVKFKNGGIKERNESETDPEERLDQCIAVLRTEMLSLRQQDSELLKQLTTLNERIEDLKELSKVHGGLFESCEDEGDVEERLNTSRPDVQINRGISRTIGSPRTGGVSEGHTRFQSVNGDNGERMSEDGVRRLQETSFEYIEEPSSVPAKQRKSGKQSQPGTPSDDARKSSLRLGRKSVSCQFLDSRGDARGIKRYSEHFEPLGKRDNSTQMSEQFNENARNINTKQKSLSMCQLRRTTKATEVPTTKATEVPMTKAIEASTSESECSTSGCYGGSSTGSELDLERHVTYGESSTEEEEREKSETDKVFALRATKTKYGYHRPTTTQPGRFRKQIVSV